jgi:hypothetical protein
MRLFSRIAFLFIIVTLTMANYSQVNSRPTTPQAVTSSTNTYLPMTANHYPLMSTFGVDGKGSFDRMKAVGVRWLRLNAQVHWSEIEATQGVYDWSKASNVDSLVIEASKQGLNVILLVQTAPVWARVNAASVCGPIHENHYASFGNFLNQVVQRYSQPPYNVKYYQIWNEPDAFVSETDTVFGCWANDSTENAGGEHYGKMLAQVYPRIKTANPSAQVVMGSLTLLCDPRDPNPENYCADSAHRKLANFFKGVMVFGRNAFDMVLFNSGPSYASGENPVWSELNNWRWKRERGGLVNGKIDYLRSVMAANGVDKPIIHSEAYLLDRPIELTQAASFEDYKADYLVWVYANGWSRNLKAVIWYSIEGWKGSELIINGTQETKAFQALTKMIAFTMRSRFVSRDEAAAGYTRFIFRDNSEDIWLLVPTGKVFGTTYNITVPANFRLAVDLYGQPLTASGGKISFSRPIYLFVGQ